MSDGLYDERRAATYRHAREVPRSGLVEWREAVARELPVRPDVTVVDVGAGTGAFATAFADWFGWRVVAVEPSAAMRALIPEHPLVTVVQGDAARMPVADRSADCVWLSTMIHHITDLPAAVHELRRVLRPHAPVLIRQPFPDRPMDMTHTRFFPDTARLLETYPTLEGIRRAFANQGFELASVRAVAQYSAPSTEALLALVDDARASDTLLRSLSEEEFRTGCERIGAAVRAERRHGAPIPVIDHLDLAVFRHRCDRSPSVSP